MLKIYGQSTKESYRDDIETSRKQKTIFKIFEWMDDHSYGNSKNLGFYLEKLEDDIIYMYLFQEDGPKKIKDLAKFIEWRRSGESNEIGHKGGGNKRNIYGYNCDKVDMLMRIDEKNILTSSTKPNGLYALATSDIDEQNFRSESDSSKYIKNPEIIHIRECPSWYKETFDKILKESKIKPNFIIRFELNKVPEEFIDQDKWNEFINQIRAKQYTIPIHFKNELLGMKKYESFDNLDFVGINDPNRIAYKEIPLYVKVDNENIDFYIENENEKNKYFNIKKPSTVLLNTLELKKWGIIKTFIVSKEYFHKSLKDYNSNISSTYTLRAEDFYGIYLILNNKLTNYLPFDGKLLGDSRNNNINLEEGQKNNGRFRMVFIPDNETCKDSNIFDSLIQTREIKALTNFLDKSPWREIVYQIIKMNKKNTVKPPFPLIKKDGGVYIVHLGNGLWKYGMVTDYEKNMDKRLKEHKRKSKSKIKEFNEYLIDTKQKKSVLNIVYCEKTNTPKGDEEKIAKFLDKISYHNKREKISKIPCCKSSSDEREYFVCDDYTYLINCINNNLEL